MDNFLPNGAVLPSGLLDFEIDSMEGFKKTYQNTSLRVGVIIATYAVGNDKNSSGLTTEYDVLVFEQNEDHGSTSILYRNCMAAEGLGSIADFFEKNLRAQDASGQGRNTQNASGQNGAVVLLLCLDGMSEKGIIITALTHPDRKTTLADEGPQLQGEYNGVNITINEDGSCSLTFKGATDNTGTPTDSTQGTTTLSIAKDGSYSFDNGGVQESFAKTGAITTTAKDNISVSTQKDYSLAIQGMCSIMAQKDMTISANNWTTTAQGTAMIKGQKVTVNADSSLSMMGDEIKMEASSMASIKGSTIVLDGNVSLGGQGGQPVLLLATQMMGTGNLGIPVISVAIAGYATKVLAT